MTILHRFRFLLLYLFVIFLEVNKLGIQIKEKIVITSSLDFSWFIDSIQRFQQGYLLGRDFTFTYGPLFQTVYSLPSLMLKAPSYIIFLINPLISVTVVYLMLLVIVKLIEKNKNEQLILFSYLLFFVGVISYASVDLIKILSPLTFALLWQRYIIKINKQSKFFLIILPLLPTVAGAFSYDLFIYCLVIAVASTLLQSLRKKGAKVFLPVVLAIAYQVIFSFILSSGLGYIIYSLDAIDNYLKVLNSFWTFDRSNFLYIFPIILVLFLFYRYKKWNTNKEMKVNLFIFSLVSLFFLQSGLIRSDSGHILRSLYPSIIAVFIILYYLIKKEPKYTLLALILFLFVPYKASYVLSSSGIKTVINTLTIKPQFNSIYALSNNYLNKQDISGLSEFIQKNKGNVLIYPYDNYLLDINNTTYNAFPLQFYLSSNNITEERGVEILRSNSPKFIVYMVDQKGALNLDNIPNITRNSLFSKWVLTNYSVQAKNEKYLILKYDISKKSSSIVKNDCSLYEIQFLTNIDKSIPIFKKPIYYIEKMRIPKIEIGNRYIFFDGFSNAEKMSQIFSGKINFDNFYLKSKQIKITRYSPFLKKTTSLELNDSNSKIYCYN